MSKLKVIQTILEKIARKDITSATEGFSGGHERNIVFYNLHSNEKAVAVFKDRLSSSKDAYVIVCSEKIEQNEQFKENVIFLISKDYAETQTEIVNKIYPLELANKKFVGITGTNGKTTTVHLVRDILYKNNASVLSIGTVGVWLNNKQVEDTQTMTSPGFVNFRKILFKYQDVFDCLVMEVSSHALEQKRIRGVDYDFVAWTSFTQDHLDFHQTMDGYFNAKIKLFNEYLRPNAIAFVPKAEVELREKILKEMTSPQQLRTPLALAERYSGPLPPFFQISFNKSNLEIAWEICENILNKKVQVDPMTLATPEGRLEIHVLNEKTFVIDSAHTPDALENALRAVKQAFPRKSLYVLFGCGGDRDRKKRPVMASIASKHAEKIFLTSDNLRNEDPAQIISDIVVGIDLGKTVIEIDREKAVLLAYKASGPETVCLMAGKGPERYQIVKGNLLPYSELGALQKAMQSVGELI